MTRLDLDENSRNVMGGVSSATDTTPRAFRYNPTSRGLEIHIVGDEVGIGGGTQYNDGDSTVATPTGTGIVFDDAGTITFVSDSNPLPVSATIDTTGLATSAKQDTGNTSLASIDGKITAVNTGDVTISAALPAGTNAIGKLAANSGVDVGDVTINNSTGASAVNIQDGGNSITVDSPVGTPTFVRLSDGSAAISTLPVSLASVPSHAVTNAGTFAVQASGNVAHDSVDSGNPVKTGGMAKTANPTAVSDGDRANFITDKLGKQIVVGAIRDLKGQQKTTITSSTTETTIVTAVTSTFLDLYGLIIANTSASACKVTIKDSSGGTTRFVFYVPAGDTRGFMLPVDSAVPQATVNTAWTATCGTSVDSIEITALYVKNI